MDSVWCFVSAGCQRGLWDLMSERYGTELC